MAVSAMESKLKHLIDAGDDQSLQAYIGSFDVCTYQKLLRYCVECDQVGCLKVVAQYCDHNDTTALLRSAQYGHVKCVEFLIPTTHREYDVGVAMVNAASYGHVEWVHVIAPFCNLYFFNQALIEAHERKQLDIAQWLEHAINCRQNQVLHNSIFTTNLTTPLRKI